MLLIAITLPDFVRGEAGRIERMLARGSFGRVHLRKPGAREADMRRLIAAISPEFYPALSVHDCFGLAAAHGLGGIHLNSRNPSAPEGWHGLLSRSCHSLGELRSYGADGVYDYLFLSPVFDSISKSGYRSAFDLEQLRLSGLTGPRVVALGGVTPARLPELAAAGFGGAAMLGAAWSEF